MLIERAPITFLHLLQNFAFAECKKNNSPARDKLMDTKKKLETEFQASFTLVENELRVNSFTELGLHYQLKLN